MEKLFEQLNKLAKQIILTKDEKSQEREKLLNFMTTHPARSISLAHQSGAWSNILSSSWQLKPVPVFATIILAVFAIGGISLASQSSLPGNALYPIKLKTEEVRSVLAFSFEAKAKLETELAQNRLEEAEELSNESKLDENMRTELESNFEKHANRVEKHAKELASTDVKAAADISSNLEISLKAHDKILSKLATVKEGKTVPEINKLLIKIRSETKDANKNKDNEEGGVRVQAQVDVQVAAQSRLNSAKNKIVEVRVFISRVKATIGADATTNAEARLQIAEQIIIQGKTKLDINAYNDAFLLFGQAHQTAQEAKLLIQAKKDFNLDVRPDSDTRNDTKTEDKKDSSDSVRIDSRLLKLRLGL